MDKMISGATDEACIDYLKLIQGRYELERITGDFSQKGYVPDFAFNILNVFGLLYSPVIDEHRVRNGVSKPVWPEERAFAVCLTHDVDHVSTYSLRQLARMRAYRLAVDSSLAAKARVILGCGMDVITAAKHMTSRDPLHCYEHWLRLEEGAGAHSTFFFWPGWKNVGKHHSSDCLYDMEDRLVFDGCQCSVAEMIREIDHRGWEIGLHPSWYSFDDEKELKRQKEALETVLGHDIISIRQHYLHWDLRVTPRVHVEAGFRYDSSIGFNDNIGFRFGTSYPWRLYDPMAEEELPLWEIPLIIQDGAMLNPAKGMRLDEETGFQYVVRLASAVERVGGVLTLLWHPNSVTDVSWWSLYVRSLQYLREKRAWLGSVKEIMEYYEKLILR